MALPLPVIDTYAFPVTVPSSNTQISLRPYLVREEKILLMAQESTNYSDQAEAVGQVILNCTNGAVDPRRVPFFDIEYLLLQIRARSVGEVATPTYQCHNVVDGVECNHRTVVRVNLADIKVEGNMVPPPIELTPKYTLALRWPTIFTVDDLFFAAVSNNVPNTSGLINKLADLFDKLVDTETGTEYAFVDYTEKEKIDFLETLPTSCYDKLVEFVGNMPSLKTSIDYKCERCGFEHHIGVSGLADFLAWG